MKKTSTESPNLIYIELGRERDLALAELLAVYPEFDVVEISGAIAIVSSPAVTNPKEMMARLGGAVKIGTIDKIVPGTAPTIPEDVLLSIIDTYPGRNVGLTILAPGWTAKARDQLLLKFKRTRRSSGNKNRVIRHREMMLPSTLSGDQLLSPRGKELIALFAHGQWYLGILGSVQAWRDWQHFDVDRPARHPRRGMLPPKLARILVNLVGRIEEPFLDPFAGVGTLVQEAARVGYQHLLASDQDPQAVRAITTNWHWFDEQKLVPNPTTLTTFATSLITLKEKLDTLHIRPRTIVTEAYLGPPTLPRMSPDQQRSVIHNLTHQYRDWLDELANLIHRDGVLVLAAPYLPQTKLYLPLIELAQTAGWHVLPFRHLGGQSRATLTYARPDQTVGREIIRLRKA